MSLKYTCPSCGTPLFRGEGYGSGCGAVWLLSEFGSELSLIDMAMSRLPR